MTAAPLPPPQRPRRGFTLVELVVVLLVIGVLAGVALPAMLETQQRAAHQAVITDVLALFQAAQLYHAEHGEWPRNGGPGNLPRDFRSHLSAADYEAESPVGGHYDWNGPGTQYPTIGFGLVGGGSAKHYQALDDLADDGDLSTGWITRHEGKLNFALTPK